MYKDKNPVFMDVMSINTRSLRPKDQAIPKERGKKESRTHQGHGDVCDELELVTEDCEGNGQGGDDDCSEAEQAQKKAFQDVPVICPDIEGEGFTAILIQTRTVNEMLMGQIVPIGF